MGTPLRVLAFLLLAVLAIAVAKEGGGPRRPTWRQIEPFLKTAHHARSE
jgi:hypothetical protein